MDGVTKTALFSKASSWPFLLCHNGLWRAGVESRQPEQKLMVSCCLGEEASVWRPEADFEEERRQNGEEGRGHAGGLLTWMRDVKVQEKQVGKMVTVLLLKTCPPPCLSQGTLEKCRIVK